MSYINKKSNVFNQGPDTALNPRRSECRIKTYLSATDTRSWAGSTEDRRQHILDVVRRDYDKCMLRKRLVPIGFIINMLLANNKDEIKRLQKKIEELEKNKGNEISIPPPPKIAALSAATSVGPSINIDDVPIIPSCKEQEEELRKAQEACNQLKAIVKQLEDERAQLLKKVEDCECQMQNQKNKIKRLRRLAPCRSREAPSGRVEHVEEPRLPTTKEMDDETNRQMLHQLDELKSKGESLKTKLELERRRCNEIVTKYTSTVTNMKLEIDIIKRANGRRRKRLRNTTFNESMGDIVICPCASSKSEKMELDLADRYKHDCVLLQRDSSSDCQNCLCDSCMNY